MLDIESTIRPSEPSFQQNQAEMLKLLEKLNSLKEESLYQGEEKHIQRALKQGKLTARQRIDLLLDPMSPFLELMAFARLDEKDFGVGGTVVGGIGLVSNKLCMIIANVGTLKGGAVDYTTLKKTIRLHQIAKENGLITLNLVESSGANLPDQARIFNEGGENFRALTQRSKLGYPSISIVFGNATAGGAYIPGMSDYTIMVQDKAHMFLAGPPLVKMATNEVTSEEELGGAHMHSYTSGASDFMAESEEAALELAKKLVRQFSAESFAEEKRKGEMQAPKLDPEELLGIMPVSENKFVDAREVILRIIDASDFTDFKPNYGSTLITGFAEIMGFKVGILANNGVIFSESANKGAQFIQLCNQQNIPLLFMHNTTGFMVGKNYEEEGIIKHGAKLINAVANSEAPAISLMIGGSFGAGNYAMNGRSYNPRFLFSWPNHQIAVMGHEQLSGVMEIIQKAAAKKMGVDWDEEEAAKKKALLNKKLQYQSSAWYSTSQLWDDGIIDPRDSRMVIGLCLETIHNKPFKGSNSWGVFRM